jgi:hypothetical protein
MQSQPRLWVNLEFSWDEARREWVLAERGIDFLRVVFELFGGRPPAYGADTARRGTTFSEHWSDGKRIVRRRVDVAGWNHTHCHSKEGWR